MGKTKSRKPINMLDYEFQTWKVISLTDRKNTGNNVYWLCECQVCGKQKELCGSEIRAGRTGACKHTTPKKKIKTEPINYLKTDQSSSAKIKDETNNVYGRLKVVSFAFIANSNAYWNCICDCGETVIARGNALRTKRIQSCGCLRSYKEEEIKEILNNHNISFQREYSFKDLKDKQCLRFDFAIFNEDNKLMGLIEYHGQQHYADNCLFNHFGQLQEHDLMKQKYCEQNHIPLLVLNKDNNLAEDIIKWYYHL